MSLLRPAAVVVAASLSIVVACATSAPPVSFEFAGDPIPVGPMAGRPLPVDLDGDGDLDLAVICGPCCGRDPDPESGHVLVLRNDGAGRFTPAGPRVPLGPTALGGATGDVNHDGHPDVVAYHHQSYDVAVLLGNGTGRLAAPRMVTLHDGDSAHVHSVALADVNGDTHLDVLATLVDDHALAVLLGDGRGAFTPALGQPYFAHQHPYAQLNPAEVNGDGAIDVVLTDVRGGGLTVLVGSGTGMFAPLRGFDLNTTMPITAAERPMACALGDIDGDGDLDAVAFIDESPQAVRMRNVGGGHYEEPDDALIDLGSPSVGGTLVDVNGDGRVDIVASGTMTRVITICLGRADGTFGAPIHVDVRGTSPGVAVADLDGDGRLDLATGNYDSGTVSILRNVTGE